MGKVGGSSGSCSSHSSVGNSSQNHSVGATKGNSPSNKAGLSNGVQHTAPTNHKQSAQTKIGFNHAGLTKATLNKALDAKTKPKASPTKTPNFNNIKHVKGNPNVTAEFKKQVTAMAKRLGTKPENLMAVMSFESKLNPKAVNKVSKATGLIQFMPKTAKALGTTTAALKNMTATQQLKYVEKYLQPFKGKLNTLEGVYTSVLAGKAHNNPNDVLFSKGKTYSQNSGLDTNKDHKITVREATAAVARMFSGF